MRLSMVDIETFPLPYGVPDSQGEWFTAANMRAFAADFHAARCRELVAGVEPAEYFLNTETSSCEKPLYEQVAHKHRSDPDAIPLYSAETVASLLEKLRIAQHAADCMEAKADHFEKRVKELEADAKRYRWLRIQPFDEVRDLFRHHGTEQQRDTAIDALIAHDAAVAPKEPI